MGLGIKKLLIEAEELANKIHAIDMQGVGIPTWLASRKNSMKLKLTHLNDQLHRVGKKQEVTIILFADGETEVKNKVIYPTHDDYELSALFARDFGERTVLSVSKIFTAEKF